MAASHAGRFPGELRSPRCPSHWFTGSDETARFACSRDAYRIAFAQAGQESARTEVEPAALIRVDAIVRAAAPRRAHPLLDPGIGCWMGDDGWIAELGSSSKFVIVADGSASPLASGRSPAVHRLSAWNHMVLTCDATGRDTRVTLRVNGKVVARDVVAGKAVRFDRFGMFASSEAGATLEVSRIVATTR